MLSIYIKHIKNKYLCVDKNPFLLLLLLFSLSWLFLHFDFHCMLYFEYVSMVCVCLMRICFDFNPLHNLFLVVWMQCSGNNSVDNIFYTLSLSHSIRPFNAFISLHIFLHFHSASVLYLRTLFYPKKSYCNCIL